jgi:hypothetical protein
MAKSSIETKFIVQEYPADPKRAALTLFVTVDGEDMGSVCIMSGNKEEVIAFSKGEMSLLEVRQAWNRNRPIRKT